MDIFQIKLPFCHRIVLFGDIDCLVLVSLGLNIFQSNTLHGHVTIDMSYRKYILVISQFEFTLVPFFKSNVSPVFNEWSWGLYFQWFTLVDYLHSFVYFDHIWVTVVCVQLYRHEAMQFFVKGVMVHLYFVAIGGCNISTASII